jgi:hypothetical protein
MVSEPTTTASDKLVELSVQRMAPTEWCSLNVHGWGLAVDLALFKKGAKNPITSQVIRLLCGNAAEFGFCWEIDSKPWHLVYFAGDEILPAVSKTENNAKRFLTYEEFKDLHNAR